MKKRKGSRASTDSNNGKEEKVHADIQEAKVQTPIPSAAKTSLASEDSFESSPRLSDIISPTAPAISKRSSLAISQRNSLPRMLSMGSPLIDGGGLLTAGVLSETLETPEEDTTDDEHVGGIQSASIQSASFSDNRQPDNEPELDRYDATGAVNDIVNDIVNPVVTSTIYNPEFTVDNESDKEDKKNEAVAPAEAPVTNEMELHALTLLRGVIRNLEDKVERNSENHPGYAVDRKLLLILQTLEKRFSTAAGKRVLQVEADKFHNGNIFEAEKSFVHTFRQSLLLRMAPPTAKRFHEHKNTRP